MIHHLREVIPRHIHGLLRDYKNHSDYAEGAPRRTFLDK